LNEARALTMNSDFWSTGLVSIVARFIIVFGCGGEVDVLVKNIKRAKIVTDKAMMMELEYFL